jgi:glycosyltransferase involved in cell wall biosynthesis
VRIALFTETFLPTVNGVVTTLCHLLDYLERQGVPRLLFAPAGAPATYGNTRVIRYPGIPFPMYPDYRLVPPFMPVASALDRFQPDLIHVLSPIGMGLAGMRHARRRGIPLVASFHTDLPGFAARWGLSALERPAWAALRWIHNRADLNLCPSEATRRQLERRDFSNTGLWTRGVDTARFHPRKRNRSWRHRLSNGNHEAPLLLVVSRLSQEKRIDWLLPVLQALPEARLAIVGDGPDRQRLEHLFRGAPVVFTGFLHGEALAQAYASADIFTFPAANETLGNVVLEAMASGLPVVAVDSGGPRDLVKQGENGLLVPPEEVERFVEAVRTLVQRPFYAEILGANARRYATGRTWSSVFDDLLADYRRLIQAAPAPAADRPRLEHLTHTQ